MELLPDSNDSQPTITDGFTDADDLLSPGNSTGNEYSCEVCGIALTYGGRGRKPRFCADHKPSRSQSQRVSGTNIDTLIGQMTDLYIGVGSAVSFVPQATTDGMIISSKANALAESWRPLLIRDPKIRKFWERLCTGGGWGTVIMAHSLVALSIMQAHNVTIPGFSNPPEREPINE